jgi:rod shape-determining protein MreC
LFLEETTLGYQMLGLGLLSALLMFVDHATGWLDESRSTITTAVSPVVVIADLPNRSARGITELLSSRESLRRKISSLENELILLRVKTEQMAALTAENNRLRDLLGSAAKLQDNVLVAELIGVNPNPQKQEIIVDKGRSDGVFVGQPVLDALGLLGQVIGVSQFNSRVLLISDEAHSVPVQVLRSNLRLVAQGTGIAQQLELLHVNSTADIEVGDQLLSSGLGNRFPVGYPVGIVDQITYEPGKPFAVVKAIPSARLDRSRHVLLVFSESRTLPELDGADPESANLSSRSGTGDGSRG